jgi:hypothetical protein
MTLQRVKEFIWPFGVKHKGRPLPEIVKTDRQYLDWVLRDWDESKDNAKRVVQFALEHADELDDQKPIPTPRTPPAASQGPSSRSQPVGEDPPY